VGEARARVWRLSMAGSRVSFAEDYLELHQVLGTNTHEGDAAMPLRTDWLRASGLAPIEMLRADSYDWNPPS